MSVFLVVLAYVIGSVPFAVIVTRAMRLPDPRDYGSKNPGATNVLRSGNKLAALLTLLGDGAKGYLAVWIAQEWGAPEPFIAAAALAVFLGHLFPLFLQFRGGKGVATSFGAWLALDALLGLIGLAIWALIAALTRVSSVAALSAALVSPLVSWWHHGFDAVTVAVIVMVSLLVFRHKGNIRKLLARSEERIGAREDTST
jgi:acyl phosphate:glycerol-3-phosphate acyltransferase